ncbi:MAG: ATP-binding protein [Myxococcota bacterium]
MSPPQSRAAALAAPGVAIVGARGDVRTVNQEMLRFLGVARDEVIGSALAPRLSRDVFDRGQEVRELECELEPHAGPPLPVAVSTIALRDRGGSPTGWIVVLRDLREMVALRSRLVTSGRLAAVGELAAGIAHEINNPMAYVRTNLGLLRDHWESVTAELGKREASPDLQEVLAEGGELLDESLEGVERATAIVRDVRELSHAGDDLDHADVGRLLEQVLRMARPQLGAGIRVECQLAPLPPLPCVPQRLQQVLLNLVINAAQAMGGEGTLRVGTALTDERVIVRVEDDGPGIPPELLERIFDPFFTTKPVGEGTGLGLAIAHEIVRQHGGEIAVDCPADGGTRFEVRLPLPDAIA